MPVSLFSVRVRNEDTKPHRVTLKFWWDNDIAPAEQGSGEPVNAEFASGDVKRAKEVLSGLEERSRPASASPDPQDQMSLFQPLPDPEREAVFEALSSLSLDHMTPLQALQFLQDLQQSLHGKAKA